MPAGRPTVAVGHGSVPVAWRQLCADPAKLGVALLAVAAALALVLVLSGLRRGMGEQVVAYLERQPPVLVGQAGSRNFIGQTSVVPDAVAAKVARVPGVADSAPISEGYAMLRLHGRLMLTLLVGFEPGGAGGPWALAEGRAPRARGELVVDRVLALEHGLERGSTLRYGGVTLEIVGLSRGTSGFMTPLAFTTRETANGIDRQPATATFLLVTPEPGVAPGTLARRIEAVVPGVSAPLRDELVRRDRALFVDSFSGTLLAMVLIAAMVAVLVIALTVYTSTRDRSREYATLKAIGLGRRALVRLVVVQAGALALSGTALGILLAVAAARAVSSLAPQYLIALSAGDAVTMALAALASAAVAGLVPARYLARLDPASAFRR